MRDKKDCIAEIMRMHECKNYRPEGRWQDGLREWCESIPQTNRDTIVQVGVFGGDATLIFCEYFNRVIDVDMWLDWKVYEAYVKKLADSGNMAKVLHIRGTSLDAAKMLQIFQKHTGHEFANVYIDANHNAPHPENDIRAYLPLLPDHGYIGGHDYNMPGVKSAVNAEFGAPDKIFQDDSWIVFKESQHGRL